MLKRRILALLLALTVWFTMFPAVVFGAVGDSLGASGDGLNYGRYAPDQIIIKFHDRSLFPDQLKQYDDEVARVLKTGLDRVCENTYVIKAEDFSKNPKAILNRYKNSKYVEYAEPDYYLEYAIHPNDPHYETNLASIAAMINAPAGWDIINGGGPVIAVVDSGVVSTHPDLPEMTNGYSVIGGPILILERI